MTARTCRICKATAEPAEVFPLAWECWRCASCGTVQTTKLPTNEELAEVYGGSNYLDTYTAGMNPEKYKREMPRRYLDKVKLIRRFAPSAKSLIDIGCGDGLFIRYAMDHGYEAVGCDYGLKSSYPDGVQVRQGDLCSRGGIPFPDASFDAVTFWAVIEHLREPAEALAEIARILKPGGVVFCDTPLMDDPAERLAAAYSHWLIPPKHIHCFSARALRSSFEQAGFEIVEAAPFYERNLPRWIARNGRNAAVGIMLGGARRLLAPGSWRAARRTRVTQIGNIQLIIGRKPA